MLADEAHEQRAKAQNLGPVLTNGVHERLEVDFHDGYPERDWEKLR